MSARASKAATSRRIENGDAQDIFFKLAGAAFKGPAGEVAKQPNAPFRLAKSGRCGDSFQLARNRFSIGWFGRSVRRQCALYTITKGLCTIGERI